MSLVPVWHTVTVAFAPGAFCISNAARGLPTMLLRPRIATCFPPGSFPDRTSICCTPAGVAGRKRGAALQKPAAVDGVHPVDVLIRADREDDLPLLDVRGQRKLDQDAVETFVGVESRDDID